MKYLIGIKNKRKSWEIKEEMDVNIGDQTLRRVGQVGQTKISIIRKDYPMGIVRLSS